MTIRVPVKPQLLYWACERAGHDVDAYAHRFPALADWLTGNAEPTLKQLEAFAKATHTPVGYFFLLEAPVERVPLPDFRAKGGEAARPSPNLLDMIYVCQQRQEWYREHARANGFEALPFVGSARVGDEVIGVAERIRKQLGFDLAARARMGTWTEALRCFIEQADGAGILVMCSGVVLNNNNRPLDPDEFRGFALADTIAPLVFVNGADTKAAQMFTVAHELAHIWAGASALSDDEPLDRSRNRGAHGLADVTRSRLADETEWWCNRVAAEVLVPLAVVRTEYRRESELATEMDRLARMFKVSSLVILRRIYDAGGLRWPEYEAAYAQENARRRALTRTSGGGNFYLTQAVRVSKRFARALVASTLEGQTLHRDALRMLGFSKTSTFQELGRSLGVG